MSEPTPTEMVKANRIAALEASQDVVDFDFALELATELERVKDELLQAETKLASVWLPKDQEQADAVKSERDQLKRQVEKLSGWLETETMNRESFEQLRAQNDELVKDKERLKSQIKSLLSPYDTFGNYDQTLNMKAVVQKIRQAIDEARHE